MGQPITVTVGPLVAADPDGLATVQATAAAQRLVLNGALADEVANAVCASQSPGGAGNLTINGTRASGGVAYLGSPRQVYVTSLGDDSAITATIYGTGFNANGIYGMVETITLADTGVSGTTGEFATVTRIAISGASAAAITVGYGGVATLDAPRHIAIDSDGDDSTLTAVITGTNGSGNAISETLALANAGVATSVLDYKTVTSVTVSGATATTLEVGSSAVASSRWVRFDDYAGMAEVAIQATINGTVNYTIQQTLQDPNDPTSPVADDQVSWVNHPTAALVGASANQIGFYGVSVFPVPVFARVLLNSGTGSVSTVFRQVYTG
jgi:hypothetical protein